MHCVKYTTIRICKNISTCFFSVHNTLRLRLFYHNTYFLCSAFFSIRRESKIPVTENSHLAYFTKLWRK